MRENKPKPVRVFMGYLSQGLCVCLFLIYLFRPSWAAALTIFPAWVWLIFLLPALLLLRSRLFLGLTISWLLFGIFHVEEWQSLLRSFFPEEQHSVSLRVTTINCSGSIDSLNDAFMENPDIILVQESPGQLEIESLVQVKKGYAYLYGFDASIIARGKLDKVQNAMFYTAGTVEIYGRDFFVVSLRLLTSSPRIDLWNPDCWRMQSNTRKRQVEQLTEVAGFLPDDSILIIGGDFNVPQRDKVFSVIRNKTRDTFKTGGRGWCNTILADYPLLRIDQIWTSDELCAFHAYSRLSTKTDHRLYTAELKFE